MASYVLHESAAGYSIFEVVQMEEIAKLSESSQESLLDLARFSRMMKLKAFEPFKSKEDALDNINAISNHAMHKDLKVFLELNLPKMSKKGEKSSFTLGVVETGLATAISSELTGLTTKSDDTTREILRGVRLHFATFIPGLSATPLGQQSTLTTAQLGLGHSYSRSRVKFNPARTDNMVIQSIALLDQLDKDLNTFAMRVREWYSWHFPELKETVKDNYMYARCAALIEDKKSLFGEGSEEKVEKLVTIIGDKDVAATVVASAKTSMGMDCSPIDMININSFTLRMVGLAQYRKQLSLYLSEKMNDVAPNLSALIGDTVAARLISKAGSLTNLAKAPASTVQILGAEKALFRALKTKGNTPKYGLIYHSTFIGRAETKNKGRISRYLANKCSIASRIDSFGDDRTRAYGEKLKSQVEQRLRFYETGERAQKNVDAMSEVANGLKKDGDEKTPKKEKKEKKGKKEKEVAGDAMDEEVTPKKSEKKEKKEKSEKKGEKRVREEVVVAEEVVPEKKSKKEKTEKSAKKEKKLKQ